MITRKLNIGDYIFTAKGDLARITKINKQTYSYEIITAYYGYTIGNVAFNGIKHSDYYGDHYEWFECDNVQAKALELAFKRYKAIESTKNALKDVKELIGKAKYFLNQINDVEEIEVEEE